MFTTSAHLTGDRTLDLDGAAVVASYSDLSSNPAVVASVVEGVATLWVSQTQNIRSCSPAVGGGSGTRPLCRLLSVFPQPHDAFSQPLHAFLQPPAFSQPMPVSSQPPLLLT